mgnify:CR=1 FL=1
MTTFNIAGLSENLQSIADSRVYALVASDPQWFDDILPLIACQNLVLITYKDPQQNYPRLLGSRMPDSATEQLTVYQVSQRKIQKNR